MFVRCTSRKVATNRISATEVGCRCSFDNDCSGNGAVGVGAAPFLRAIEARPEACRWR